MILSTLTHSLFDVACFFSST